MSRAKRFRQAVGHKICIIFNSGASHSLHRVELNTFGQRIAWQHARAGFEVIIRPQNCHTGAIEFPSSSLLLRLTTEDQMFVVPILLKHPRLIEPKASNKVPVALEHDPNQRTAAIQLTHISITDKAVNRLFFVRFKPRHRSHIAEIIDAGGNMKQQITSRQYPQILQ